MIGEQGHSNLPFYIFPYFFEILTIALILSVLWFLHL